MASCPFYTGHPGRCGSFAHRGDCGRVFFPEVRLPHLPSLQEKNPSHRVRANALRPAVILLSSGQSMGCGPFPRQPQDILAEPRDPDGSDIHSLCSLYFSFCPCERSLPPHSKIGGAGWRDIGTYAHRLHVQYLHAAGSPHLESFFHHLFLLLCLSAFGNTDHVRITDVRLPKPGRHNQ